MLGERGADYLAAVSESAGAKARKVAVFHEQGPFGTAVTESFTKKAESLGMTVGPVISYDPANVSDFTTQVTTVKAEGADVLVVAGYYRDGVLVANGVNAVKPGLAAVYGVANGAFDLPQFPKDVGPAGEGYFDANYHLDTTNPETAALAQLYQQKYNDQIRTGAVLAYDAVRVIADSLERAKSADPAALRDAIAKTDLAPLVAADGPITFTETGENANAAPILMQVQQGVVKQTYPKEKAETAPIYPATQAGA